MYNKIWLTWENQIRNIGISDYFGFHLIVLTTNHSGIIRYIVLCYKTIKEIVKSRPSTVACQNPSVILALVVVLLKFPFRYRAIVDRHTNFKFDTAKSLHPKWIIFHCINKISMRLSDLTIVTNPGLGKIVKSLGGTPAILPDRLPDINLLHGKSYVKPSNRKKIFYVCTFAYDEPTEEVIDIAKTNYDGYDFYISGNWKKRLSISEANQLPDNIILLGYLPYEDYVETMKGCDAVLSITMNRMTMTCGAYEGLALNKVVIGSNTYAMRSYFGSSILYIKTSSRSSFYEELSTFLKNGASLPSPEDPGISVQMRWEALAKEIDI